MDKLKITSSPWGFRFTPLEEQCRWLADHDLPGICGQCFKDAAGMFSPHLRQEEAQAALEMVRGHGLQYASFNATGDFTVRDNVAAQVKECCRYIDMAKWFEPEVIIVFAGWQERHDDAVYAQVGDALKDVAQYAGELGLTVALENHGGITTHAEQINRILARADQPNLGVNYDPANFAMYGADPLASLEQIEAPIVFTHFKSVRHNQAGKLEYCRLRDGEIDYGPIIKALLARDYQGWWAIEYEEPRYVMDGSTDDLKSLQTLLNEWTAVQSS